MGRDMINSRGNKEHLVDSKFHIQKNVCDLTLLILFVVFMDNTQT